jgi:hypothetical protein
VFAFAVTLLVVSLEVPETFVYPMKYLFAMLFDQLFGDAPANAIRPDQVPLLMCVYAAGFVAVQLVFLLLYLRAYRLADDLELDAYESLMPAQFANGRLMRTRIRDAGGSLQP